MGPSLSKFVQFGPKGSKQVRIGSNGSKWVQTCPKGTNQVQMGHLSLNRSKWVQMGPYGSKLVQMGQYRSKLIKICLNRSKKSNMICYGLVRYKVIHILTKNHPNGSGITRSLGLVFIVWQPDELFLLEQRHNFTCFQHKRASLLGVTKRQAHCRSTMQMKCLKNILRSSASENTP